MHSIAHQTFNRIAIVSNSGVGKSTFAYWLGGRLALPVFHQDQLLWLPGWQATPESEFNRQHQRILAQERWIIDGVAYWAALEKRIALADRAVFFDLPLEVCRTGARHRIAQEQERPA